MKKVSLDSLIRLKDTDNLRDAIGNILKQAGVEASEEAFTELTNNLSDQLINGGLSNYQQAVQRYMAQGMEEAEAKKSRKRRGCRGNRAGSVGRRTFGRRAGRRQDRDAVQRRAAEHIAGTGKRKSGATGGCESTL